MKRFLILTAMVAVASMQLHGQNQYLPKQEVTINAFGGVSTLNYKLADPNIPGTLNLGIAGGAGLGFHYFFNDQLGFVTGLEAALYRASLSINSDQNSLGNAAVNTLKETQNYLALQLPLMLQFMVPFGQQKDNHFYVGVGGRVAYGVWGNFNQTFTYYREQTFTEKRSLKFAAFNAMPSVELGFRWKMGEAMGLYTGLYADYGVLNISPSKVNGDLLTYTDDGKKQNSILEAQRMSLSAVKLVEAEPYVNKVNSFAVGLKIKLAFGGSKKRSAPAPVVPVREEPRVQEVPQDIKQAMITLSNTLFAFDKFNLTPAAATELDKVVKWLNENPTLNVVIEGHTDNMGAADYNQRLSEERAKSVYEYFVSHGVSASRLSYRGYGLTRPVATNATEAGRQQNRRVELIIK